jgi:hypothetical protein
MVELSRFGLRQTSLAVVFPSAAGYGGAGDLDSDDVQEDELDIGLLDHVSQAGECFARLLQKLAGV